MTKLESFIKLCKRDIVHMTNLTGEFELFMSSDFENAYDYFCSKGMIYDVQEKIEDLQIAAQFIKNILNQNDSTIQNELFKGATSPEEMDLEYLMKTHIRWIMEHFKGVADPRQIKDVILQLVEDR